MCTAAMQKNLPDFMTNLDGTSVTTPKDGPRPISGAVDVPLGDTDAKTISIKARRESIRQAQENPGSHIPNAKRTRKQIMDELT